MMKNSFLQFFQKNIVLLLLLASSYFAISPLLSKGYFPMHDDTQVARVVEMGRALRNGQFPVRWVSDLGYGYGYPLFNFYAPLPYYVGGFFYSLGVDAVLATKLMFGIGILIAGVSMYALASSLFGTAAGLVSGLLYMYAPYHAVQVYVRGAVGEFWAIAFAPLLLLGLFGLSRKADDYRGILWGSIGLAGTILSHTLLGYTTALFLILGLVIYWLFLFFRKRVNVSSFDFAQDRLLTSHLPRRQAGFSLLLLGLGLSAFFWLPALLEMSYTNVSAQVGGSADYRNHFVCIWQLWNSPWGFGGSSPGCIDGMSFRLGKPHIVVALLSVVIIFLRKQFTGRTRYIISVSSIITFGSIFLMTKVSQVVWQIAPGFSYLQYPWRFLSYAGLGLSLVSGAIFISIKNSTIKWMLSILLSLGIVLVYAKLFTPQYLYFRPTSEFEASQELRWRVSKISDEYLPYQFIKPSGPDSIPHDLIVPVSGLSLDTEINTETHVKARVNAQEDLEITVNRTYFPGWRYTIDDKDTPYRLVNGLPYVHIPKGVHTLEITFTNTLIRSVGNILSVMALILLLVIVNRTL